MRCVRLFARHKFKTRNGWWTALERPTLAAPWSDPFRSCSPITCFNHKLKPAYDLVHAANCWTFQSARKSADSCVVSCTESSNVSPRGRVQPIWSGSSELMLSDVIHVFFQLIKNINHCHKSQYFMEAHISCVASGQWLHWDFTWH